MDRSRSVPARAERYGPGRAIGSVAALAGAGQGIGGGRGLIDDLAELVIVPAVRIVISDEDRGGIPVRLRCRKLITCTTKVCSSRGSE